MTASPWSADGQQAIYAGGYTLKEAGVSVTGRSTVLDTNYRNTRQVLEAATAVVSADAFDDLEDVDEAGDRQSMAVRDGVPVVTVAAQDLESHDVALVKRLLERGSYDQSAVLCRTGRESTRCQALLRRSGIPVLDLVDYDGTPANAVKVGTVKRAKGLEFGQVSLPRVESYLISDGAAEPERVQRERRELFVAMTRARDELWMGRLQAGRPKVY